MKAKTRCGWLRLWRSRQHRVKEPLRDWRSLTSCSQPLPTRVVTIPGGRPDLVGGSQLTNRPYSCGDSAGLATYQWPTSFAITSCHPGQRTPGIYC